MLVKGIPGVFRQHINHITAYTKPRPTYLKIDSCNYVPQLELRAMIQFNEMKGTTKLYDYGSQKHEFRYNSNQNSNFSFLLRRLVLKTLLVQSDPVLTRSSTAIDCIQHNDKSWTEMRYQKQNKQRIFREQWLHGMEPFSALLTFCEVTGGFPFQRAGDAGHLLRL